ncbi:RNA polymerase sigma factor [Polyangium sorediatum]|uniref:RNA polymerase sigma factor n=1 Tax=Polyangium sorediatum TaxID=889274 RepID=A0ABT6P8K3_9BACT|nr:RNA polymerase sigma factor [Polyangium sorediatum]MDI1436945.1 RNA polymerase sigma factor [Polyangium sorediatum]
MTTIPLHLPPANFTAAHALLGRLYLEHRAFLRRVLLGQSIPPRDVDDVVQDIFLTAWRRLECLIVPEQARPWLLVIGLNHARNHRKLSRCEREVLAGLADDFPEREDEAESIGMFVQATYGLFRLKRFLYKIGPRVRAVVMPYLEGRSIREIAESLGIKTKTAHARLHLAREHLKTLALA